ncbi:methyltransferase [Alicyclobacillus hesperidum]|uniref:Methyltransferase n=1 Tax=Alicyclobacillus hesperidum TaxID=89784 RepID=A0A1H2UCT2_9BACL|nr:class I SAM-dependent methyltransferase [Alicyclobacillus hesperidum]GLV14156.1 methyltransferase [Alicyclobacillus hesperidum]SDW53349.1 Methyltransferase domain-containing protein [Alicyclobacillus hesperidum]
MAVLYDAFADVYDALMADAPYAEWQAFLEERYRLDSLDIADIGCGTGVLTVELGRQARFCIGVDQSEAMLSIAQERAMAAGARIVWLTQDMRELRLPRPVDLAIATCDVLNYLTCEDDLRQAFRAIANTLRNGGVFAFDVIGPARLDMLQHGYWHQVDDDVVLLHETDVQRDWVRHEVVAFARVQEVAGEPLYRRIEERHQQRYYPLAQVQEALAAAGLQLIEATGDFGRQSVETADRLVCRAVRP